MTPAVELHDLVKRFGSTAVVDGLSLEVRTGEVVGLLGPNGAGKTTTLRMLAGLLRPTAGTVRVSGLEMAKDPLAARAKLGFLTASTGLYDRLTPHELLDCFGRLYGLSAEVLRGRIETLSAELELVGFLHRRCGELSSGQRQRVGIARAVVHDPPVYVLDEPTATLDPLASKAILDLVRGARDRNKAVLFSTHRMEEAEFLCDRLYFLRAGKVVAQGPSAELLSASGQRSLTGAFLHYAGAA